MFKKLSGFLLPPRILNQCVIVGFDGFKYAVYIENENYLMFVEMMWLYTDVPEDMQHPEVLSCTALRSSYGWSKDIKKEEQQYGAIRCSAGGHRNY